MSALLNRWTVRGARLAVFVALLSGAASAQVAPIPGQETNMVSGHDLFVGDPFLQRQNEPSIAVSSENPQTLLAGANDYRTVDIPNPLVEKMVGDAWMGIFKSFNGGQTWQSALLPGYPQDQSPDGLASPLKGFAAAADPVVRAGTDGLFYVTGIVFNRGTNKGQTFVARFIDLNDKQNGDPTRAAPTDDLRYVDTRVIASGTAGQFVDKPWSAVDVPRSTSATCTFQVSVPNANPAIAAAKVTRRVRAGNVYFVYATFTGTDENASSVQFARSTNCGETWSKTIKLSESTQLNQGATVAVDPVNGAIYVVWRRFRTSNSTDAILFSKSTDFGLTFSKPVTIATVAFPFDQGTLSTLGGGPQFRTTALPAIAVSVGVGAKNKPRSWVHVAWAQRQSAGAESRIVIASSEGGATWSSPVAADPPPAVGWVEDDTQHGLTRGHQLMPALTFTQGRLMLLHYDTRLTHTRRFYKPTARWLSADPENETGPFYEEELVPLGELLANPDFHRDLINDNALELYRHTIEVRAGSSPPGGSPVFATTLVSRHNFGQRGDEGTAADGTPLANRTVPGFDGKTLPLVVDGELKAFQDLAVNPPNLPLFANGTAPFIGDYIDIAGQTFVRTPAGGWAFNTAPNGAPVHHAIWTSNQDVRAPVDGDWTQYTPIRLSGQSKSVYDGSDMVTCTPGHEGMRNQNIYTSRLTEGLLIASPQNAKPLSNAFPRAFVVTVENTTATAMSVQLVARGGDNVTAMSFRNDASPAVTSIVAKIPPRTTASRSLFVKASAANASVTVDVAEIVDVGETGTCVGGAQPPCVKFGGYAGFVTLNPPGSAVSIVQPDGTSDDVNAGESFSPTFLDLSVAEASVRNASVRNGDLENASVRNASVRNASVRNASVRNDPDLASVRNASVRNASVRNSTVEQSLDSASVRNASVRNGGLTADPVSDASYTVKNEGNTTMSYRVKLVGTQQQEKLTLILLKHYATPAANPESDQCELVDEQHPVVMASVRNASVRNASVRNSTLRTLSAEAPIADPEPEYSDTQNATFLLAPGETGQITIRGAVDVPTMKRIVSEIAPVVIAHGVTDTTSLASAGIAVPLFVTTESLPEAKVGAAYSGAAPLVTLQAIGGVAPLTWAAAGVPAGVTVNAAGQIVGTPQQVGSNTVTLTVTDVNGKTAQRTFTLTVGQGTVTLRLTPSTRTVSYGQPAAYSVTASAPSAGPAPSGTIALSPTGTRECGGVDGNSFTCAFSVAGLGALGSPYTVTASYSGDTNYVATFVQASLVVEKAVPAGAVIPSANPAVQGTLTLTATMSGGATGFVQFQNGGETLPNGRVELVNGSASYNGAALPVGTYGITVYYEGDDNFLAGPIGGFAQQIAFATSVTITSSTPAPSLRGGDVVVRAKVARAPDPLAGFVTTGTCGDCHQPHNANDPPGQMLLLPAVEAIVVAFGSPIYPVGSVEFYDVTGGTWTPLGTDTGVGHGNASLTVVGGLPLGSRQLEAVFVPGSTNFLASTSPAASHEVADMTMSFAATSVGDGTLELHAILNVAADAGASPTGVVWFTASDGTARASDVVPETAILYSASAIETVFVPGTTVTAEYAGDGTFPALKSPARTIPPYYVATTALTGLGVAVTGSDVIVTATLTPAASYPPPGDTPRGLVEFFVDGAYVGARDVVNGIANYTFSSTTAATYQITARYRPQSSSTGAYAEWYVNSQPLSAVPHTIVVSSPPAPPGGLVIVP